MFGIINTVAKVWTLHLKLFRVCRDLVFVLRTGWEYVNYFYGIPSKKVYNGPIHTCFLAKPGTKLLLCFRNPPPKGEWTSSNSGFMNSMNGFFKSKHGNSLELNISAFISPEMATGAGAPVLLSPQEYKKKLLDFSSGVVSQVKSYYNASLFPSSAQKPSVPQPSAPLLSDTQTPPAKSNDYSDVVVIANNNNEAADKKIEIEPEKEQKIPETSGTTADST